MGFFARLILLALLAIHVVAFCAGFFVPYGYDVQHRDHPLAAPARLRMSDAQGRWTIRPHAGSQPVRFFVRGSEYSIAGVTCRTHLFGVDEPGRVFLLGTDAYGRDQFSRLLFGGQMSLFAGLLAAALSLTIGVLLGGIAGYCGRWPDAVIMHTAELFLAVPWVYLLFAVRAALPLAIPPRMAFLAIVAVLGSVGWAVPARLIRGAVLSLKERGFVLAARGFGASGFYLLRRHILPHTGGIIAAQASVLVPRYVLAEVTLSFLGLGVPEPIPSWGNMLAGAQQVHVLTSCWWLLAPGLALVAVVFAYIRLSDLMLQARGFERM